MQGYSDMVIRKYIYELGIGHSIYLMSAHKDVTATQLHGNMNSAITREESRTTGLAEHFR